MIQDDVNGQHLPLQQALIESACAAFASEQDVIAAVIVGSLAAGKGDRVSDADIVVFTQHGFHRSAASCFARFEAGKDIFIACQVITMNRRCLKNIFSRI